MIMSSYRRSTDEQEEAAGGSVVAELPDHLIESVLLKLSAENLIRFYSLSKQWKATIESRTFVSLHMRQLRDQQTTSTTTIVVSAECNFYNAYADRISTIRPRHGQPQPHARLGVIRDPVQVKSSNKSDYCHMHQFSSCNGLVCVTWLKLEFKGGLPTSLTKVWNPVTGKLKDVSSPLFETSNKVVGRSVITGFGYDPTIDDYKIVYTFQIVCPDKSRIHIIKVMSLKSNTWRSIDRSNSPDLSRVYGKYYDPHSQPATAGGYVYWVVKCGRPMFYDAEGPKILRFNLANEKFELLPYPDKKFNSSSKLICYNDSLYLLNPIYDSKEHIIWMLDMKDGNAIWQRVGSIPPLRFRRISTKRIRLIELEALGFNSSGHVILKVQGTRRLVAYIPKEDKFMKLDLYHNFNIIHLVEMETLLSP